MSSPSNSILLTALPISGSLVALAMSLLLGNILFSSRTNRIERAMSSRLLFSPDISIESTVQSDSYHKLYNPVLMTVRDVLQLGNPALYAVSAPVSQTELPTLEPVVKDLHDTLIAFREEYGRGRAIAAPQIGVLKRLVYMHIDRPVVFLNPVLSNCSDEHIELWDDCMSFPDLLVRVSRHKTCDIAYKDMMWEDQMMSLGEDLSELLQHECDHLDGVLAVSRAIDAHSFALTSQRHLLPRL